MGSTLPAVYLPAQTAHRVATLSDTARTMGIHIMGSRGGGKSRMMGRGIAFGDFMRGVPTVVIDPLGQTIDNLIDKFRRLPDDVQRRHHRRILYVDVSGKGGYVFPMPF